MGFDTSVAPLDGLQTDEYVLRPITAEDAQLDYDAVMESKDFLRKWEQSTWPADDFTVEANRKDMEKMERRHRTGEAYGYTVLTLDQTECLGCVYVFPPDARWYNDATKSSNSRSASSKTPTSNFGFDSPTPKTPGTNWRTGNRPRNGQPKMRCPTSWRRQDTAPWVMA